MGSYRFLNIPTGRAHDLVHERTNMPTSIDNDRPRPRQKSRRISRLPEYPCWSAMRQRCHNWRNVDYHNYGGRGITVCDRWFESFDAFLEDMGPRPSPKHSIERMDNDGNYEPGNCKWATASEQNSNQRRPPRRKNFKQHWHRVTPEDIEAMDRRYGD